MTADILKESWYVLHTKSRFENVVHDMLVRKSMEAFFRKSRCGANGGIAKP